MHAHEDYSVFECSNMMPITTLPTRPRLHHRGSAVNSFLVPSTASPAFPPARGRPVQEPPRPRRARHVTYPNALIFSFSKSKCPDQSLLSFGQESVDAWGAFLKGEGLHTSVITRTLTFYETRGAATTMLSLLHAGMVGMVGMVGIGSGTCSCCSCIQISLQVL